MLFIYCNKVSTYFNLGIFVELQGQNFERVVYAYNMSINNNEKYVLHPSQLP